MHAVARRRALVGLAALALASGCSLTTSLDGLSSGPSPGTALDGGSPDGAAPADAATDTSADGPGTDSGPIDPCAGSIFCDRFERDAVQGSWGQLQQISGGALAIDTSTFVSATRSLFMTVPTGTAPRAYLSFETPTTNHRHGRVEWSQLSDAQPDREAQLMRIELQSAQRASFVFVSFVPGQNIVLAEQRDEPGVSSSSTYSNIVLDRAFAPGKWQRWSMELDSTTSPPKAKVLVDGVVVGTKNLANPFDTGALRIVLGATFVRDGALRKVWFDDVALFDLN